MEKNIEIKYSSIIPYKINDIVKLILKKKNLNFNQVLNYLYSSKLYEYLSEEETKFWHFSPEKLLDLLEEEKQNNHFEMPDFV